MIRALRTRTSSGIAMVEMAIVLPLVLAVIFGLFDAYTIYSKKFILHDATRIVAHDMARPSNSGLACSERLKQKVLNELRRWKLDSEIISLRAKPIESPLSERVNVFELAIELRVSCISCALREGGILRLRARTPVVLMHGAFCEALPWDIEV